MRKPAERIARRAEPRCTLRRQLLAGSGLCALLAIADPAAAGPTDPRVQTGQIQVSGPAGALRIDQTSAKAIVDWHGFSVAAGETVTVRQPGADALLLNRVRGPDISRIDGRIDANGQVFLVNPNGTIVGPQGGISAAGFLATTADIRDEDFLAGRYAFTLPSGDADAAVVNEGTIRVAEGGYAALSAAMVANSGLIAAELGSVVLGGAETFTIDLEGDGLIRYRIDRPSPVEDGPAVANTGRLSSPGGQVLLTAATVRDVMGGVINVDGVVEATGVREVDGRIIIVGADMEPGDGPEGAADVTVTGRLDAGSATGKGGAIDITGGDVALVGAVVEASGVTGGGRVRIGGDVRGGPGPDGDTIAAAQTVVADAATVIRADAGTDGDGGRVVLWSAARTRFAGSLSARGGETDGDGGFAEVSSAGALGFIGRVDLAAGPGGTAGSLLLDPAILNIVPGTVPSPLLNPPTDQTIGAAEGGTTENVSVGALQGITSGTVTLEASSAINFNAPLTMATGVNLIATAPTIVLGGNVETQGGDLTFNGAVQVGQSFSIPMAPNIRSFTGDVANTTTQATAENNVVRFGDDIRSQLEVANDADFFLVDFLAGGTYDFTLTATVTGQPDTYLTVFDPGGVSLAENDDFSGLNSFLSFQPTSNFRGFVRASACCPVGAGTGSYSLTLTGTLNVGSVTVATGGGDLTFNGTVDSSASIGNAFLTIDSDTGTVRFTQAVGGTQALAGLTVTGPTALDAGAITTVGDQIYNDAITLLRDTVLTAEDATFDATVDGPWALTVNATGITDFGAPVGGNAPLTSLTTDSAGSLVLTADVTTTGAQQYGDIDGTTLAGTVNLAAQTGDIGFAGSVNGAQSLTIQATGAVTFDGAVGLVTPLAGFIRNGGGPTTINGVSFRTTGLLRIDDDAVLSGSFLDLAGETVVLAGNVTTDPGTVLRVEGGGVDFGAASFVNAANATIVLQPVDVGRAVRVGGSDGIGGDYDIPSASLAAIAGFGQVSIGRIDSLAPTTLTAGSVLSVSGALELRGNRVTLAPGSSVEAAGAGGLLLFSTGDILVDGATVTTQGQPIVFRARADAAPGTTDTTIGEIHVRAGSLIRSNGGNITFGGSSDLSTGFARSAPFANGGGPGDGRGINVIDSTVDAGGSAFGGSIVMRGQGGINAAFATGVDLGVGSVVRTNMSGTIVLEGVGGTSAGIVNNPGAGFSSGVNFFSGVQVFTENGSITTIGNSSAAGISPFSISFDADPAPPADPTRIYSSGAATISFTADDPGGIIVAGTPSGVSRAVIGGNGAQAFASDVIFITDRLGFTQAQVVTTGPTFVEPRTAGRGIAIGPTTDPGTGTTLDLSQLELEQLGGAFLQIGAANAGPVTLTQAIAVPTGRVLELRGASISQQTGATLSGATLRLDSGGSVALTEANTIPELGPVTAVGAVDIRGVSTVSGPVSTGSGPITLASPGDLTLLPGASIVNAGPGNDIALAADGDFISQIAAGNILSIGGRLQIYSQSPATAVLNGLTGTTLFQRTFAANPPAGNTEPGNLLIYANGGLLTITATDAARLYGAPDPAFGFTVTGLPAGMTAGMVLTGAPAFTTTATAASPVGPYPITVSQGTLSSTQGFLFDFVGGTLTVNPAPLTITATDAARPYGGANPAFTASFAGLVNGDTANVVTGLTFTTPADQTSPVGSYAITAGGGAATNYTLAYVPGTLTVNPAPLTITANNAQRAYGGANPAFTASFAGLVNGDPQSVVTGLNFTTAANQTSPVGNYAITASGGTAANYTLAYVPGTLTVNPAQLTITANNAQRAFGAADPAFSASFAGLVNGDPQSVVTGLTFTTTATTQSPTGSYAITPVGGTAPNYSINLVAGTLFVGQAPLTIAVNSTSRPYGQPNPAFSASFNGLLNGDTASVVSGLTFATNATQASPVGSYTITGSGATAANYAITLVPGTLTVDPAALTVTANGANRVYGGANPAFTASIAGLVNGDAPGIVTGLELTTTATAGSPVGSYPIVPSGASAPNYTISFVNGALAVDPAPLTVTANDASRTYGAANPSFTASIGGLVNGDGPGIVTGLTFSTTATAGSPAGSYAIQPGGATAPNYVVSFSPGNLTVQPASLTVTVNGGTRRYGEANPTFGASISGLVNGDPESVVTGLTFTTTATAASPVGSFPVTASGATAPNYTVTVVDGVLTIEPAALTVTANDAARRFGEPDPTFTASVTGLVNGDPESVVTGLTFTTTARAESPAGTYAITPAGAVAANYTVTLVPGTLTVGAVPLTITVNSVTRRYGEANPTFTARFTGLAPGDTEAVVSGLTFTTAATAGSPVGSFPIVPVGATAPNYEIVLVPGTLTIVPAPLTVAAASLARTYGQANPALSASITGLVNGDTEAVVSGLTLSTTATASSPVGNFPIVPSGATAPNYAVTLVPGVLSVEPAPLIIAAIDSTRRYGEANPAFSASIGGLVNGDTEAIVTGLSLTTPATPGSPVGSFPIIPTGATAPNYRIEVVAGTLTVVPAPLTVTAADASRTYGAANPAFTASIAGLVNGDTPDIVTGLGFETPATPASPVGRFPILPVGATAPNYIVTLRPGTLEVEPAPLTVAANDARRTYGAANPAFTARVTGLVNGDAESVVTGLTFATDATPGSPVGSFAIRSGGATAANYVLNFLPGTLTVDPAPLTVTANDARRTYGAANPPLTARIGGLVNGDPESIVTGLGLATPATPASDAGTFPIVPTGAVAPNYVVTLVNGTLTVDRAPLRIGVVDAVRPRSTPNPPFDFTFEGLLNGDTPSVVSGLTATTPATLDSPAGLYDILLAGGTARNYEIAFVNGRLTVTETRLPTGVSDAAPSTIVTNLATPPSTTPAPAAAPPPQAVPAAAPTVSAVPRSTAIAAGLTTPPTVAGSAPAPAAAALDSQSTVTQAASGSEAEGDDGGSEEVIPGLLNRGTGRQTTEGSQTPGIDRSFPILGRGW